MLALFLFYDQSLSPLRYFLHSRFKHVDLFTCHGDHWVIHRYGYQGITYMISQEKDPGKLVEHCFDASNCLVKAIAVHTNERSKYSWFPVGLKSCNEMARYISG